MYHLLARLWLERPPRPQDPGDPGDPVSSQDADDADIPHPPMDEPAAPAAALVPDPLPTAGLRLPRRLKLTLRP